jgi:integrase
MALFKRGGIWWYKFYFAGQFIRESSKSSSKTVAKNAEQQRRRELETGFHNLKEVRQQRIRRLNDIVDEYLVGYRLRYRSATFAEYALGHVSRLLGAEMAVDIDEATVRRYQENRLREKAAPKSINEEVRFLLKMLGESGEVIRARLRKKKQLKLAVRKKIGKAFDTEETESLTAKARTSRSPHMYPAFMLARNAGLRDTEIKKLTWGQVDLKTKSLQVGKSKSDAGEGRVVPWNSDLYDALERHLDPTRHVTSLKTAWKNVRKNAKVKGRWHDNRHTLITELAESGAGDETIMEIAGHVDRQMLRHYSHIRMKAKRAALDSALASRSPGRGRSAAEE